jgi:hypothetical protein
MMAQACFLHSATRKFLGKQSGVLVGAIKVLAVGAACDLWWFAGVAAIVLIPVIPISGNLTRPSQAILAFLFSLIALIL